MFIPITLIYYTLWDDISDFYPFAAENGKLNMHKFAVLQLTIS